MIFSTIPSNSNSESHGKECHPFSQVQFNTDYFHQNKFILQSKLVTLTTYLVFFQAHNLFASLSLDPTATLRILRPCRGLEIDEFPYLKGWPVKLEIYIADLEFWGARSFDVFRAMGHRMPSSNTSHGPPLTQSDVP